MDFELNGKTVLITGATGGISRACVHAFANEGANIIAHTHQRLDEALSLCESLATDAIAVRADVRVATDVERMFDDALSVIPKIDILVVNAGIWIEKPIPIHEMTIEQWNETLATNLTGAFLCCRSFFRHLAEVRRESTSVILVGSTAALFGEADHADYAAAKAGMVYGLTRTLKNEITRLAPRGRVNAICPGWTRTPMTESGLAHAELVARVMSTMSLQKVAIAEDIAAAAMFFASDAMSGHVSGAILPIAGGMEGRLLNPLP